jgi:hypothetical protein
MKRTGLAEQSEFSDSTGFFAGGSVIQGSCRNEQIQKTRAGERRVKCSAQPAAVPNKQGSRRCQRRFVNASADARRVMQQRGFNENRDKRQTHVDIFARSRENRVPLGARAILDRPPIFPRLVRRPPFGTTVGTVAATRRDRRLGSGGAHDEQATPALRQRQREAASEHKQA